MSTFQALEDITELIQNDTHLDVSSKIVDLRKAFVTITHELPCSNQRAMVRELFA